MTLTDEELDRDWKPNGRRPLSTIARSFSAELADIFRLENSVADLDEQVVKRKQEIDSRTAELEALEARIKEMEALLHSGGSPTSGAATGNASTSQYLRAPGAFDGAQGQQGQGEQQQVQEDASSKYGSRPGTARASRQAVPGALPPTPTESEDGDRERDA
ncbi:hypothetical protein GGTG_11112 [Gaeumannomyces tritici R3-111a-1]|uniref:Uncharacterized protein n=1 Tax=Gaeumannomyces tritici (strain R3-111a-1) TaxID=644352 RepID=J3PC89_GAET3|nr:hypothetical protein GGTG_11112 [Gaeumannomyces tritici R3-111a-1]EJT71859.1 hypothetical protein GGTG_11112 [Gaeumannomyces tritici R3-111a-1]